MPRRDPRPHVLMSWFMDDWGRFGRAYEQIANQLAESEKIARVVCLLPADWKPMTHWRLPLRVREHRRKLTAITLRAHSIPGRIGPYHLRRAVNHWLPRRLPGLIARGLGFTPENTLLWLFPPHALAQQLHGSIPRRATLVHVIDNNALMEASRPDNRHRVATQYRDLAQAADWVYVNSETNRQIFAPINRNTYHFRNAVDPAFFGTPRAPSGSVRIGYLGWITERTDVSILETIAAARPEWQMLIAAPDTPQARIRLRGMSAYGNVAWLSHVEHKSAPAFLADLDVCLMPHIDCAYSQSMHPLKLLQYLASGRPVVATCVAGVDDWIEHVRIAADGTGFVRAIEEMLAGDTPDAARRRIEAVRSETWSARVSAMLEPILEGWSEAAPSRVPTQAQATRYLERSEVSRSE